MGVLSNLDKFAAETFNSNKYSIPFPCLKGFIPTPGFKEFQHEWQQVLQSAAGT